MAGGVRSRIQLLVIFAGGLLVHVLSPLAGEAPVVVDLGCGTGICGPLFADLAGTLIGVDLSVRMLERARARGIYHATTRCSGTICGEPVPGEGWLLRRG